MTPIHLRSPPDRARFARGALAAAMLATALLLLARTTEADAPSNRYEVTEAVVLDTETSLTWERVGTTAPLSWTEAVARCFSLDKEGGGWRLPRKNELQTLVDETRANPAIDPKAFPGTPALKFWSTSTSVVSNGSAWMTDFASGITLTAEKTELQYARCVR
jgi:hypothetical protein